MGKARTIMAATNDAVPLPSTFGDIDVAEDGDGWAVVLLPKPGCHLGMVDGWSAKSVTVRSDELPMLLAEAKAEALLPRLTKRTEGAFSAEQTKAYDALVTFVQGRSSIRLGADAKARLTAGKVAHRKRNRVPFVAPVAAPVAAPAS